MKPAAWFGVMMLVLGLFAGLEVGWRDMRATYGSYRALHIARCRGAHPIAVVVRLPDGDKEQCMTGSTDNLRR